MVTKVTFWGIMGQLP